MSPYKYGLKGWYYLDDLGIVELDSNVIIPQVDALMKKEFLIPLNIAVGSRAPLFDNGVNHTLANTLSRKLNLPPGVGHEITPFLGSSRRKRTRRRTRKHKNKSTKLKHF